MKTKISAALCVAVLLSLSLAACDESDADVGQVGVAEAEVRTQAEAVSDEPLARYNKGRLTLAVSMDEAREVVMGTTRKLIDDIEEVTFEDPALEMIEDRPYLTMNGKRPDGNCAFAYVRLVSEQALASGTRVAVSEARMPQEENLELFGPIGGGGSCDGNPCNACRIIVVSGNETCYCAGHGDGGPNDPGWCDHTFGN